MTADAQSQATPESQFVGPSRISPSSLRLAGIVNMLGKSYVSISHRDSRVTSWLGVNDFHLGYYVKEIRENSVVLTERDTGREVILYLSGLGETPALPKIERYSKEWINSDENPMFYTPANIPLDIARDWRDLTDAEKTEIIELYRNFGWNLITADTVAGSTQFAWENAYKEERMAAVKQAFADFENSLTPSQQEIYAKIKATNGLVQENEGPKSAEHERADQIRRTEWPKLRATLSPEQREIYESVFDPRKAMKRKK